MAKQQSPADAAVIWIQPGREGLCGRCYVSHRHSRWSLGVFYTYFYNHARRLRIEKLLYYLELSRSSSGYFKPLLDPGGSFASKTAVT